MLFMPDRERIERAFWQGVEEQARREDAPVVCELGALELSIEESLHGRMKCLTATYWRPDGRSMDLQHMMPMGADDVDTLVAAARRHGMNAQKISLPLAYAAASDYLEGGRNG